MGCLLLSFPKSSLLYEKQFQKENWCFPHLKCYTAITLFYAYFHWVQIHKTISSHPPPAEGRWCLEHNVYNLFLFTFVHHLLKLSITMFPSYTNYQYLLYSPPPHIQSTFRVHLKTSFIKHPHSKKYTYNKDRQICFKKKKYLKWLLLVMDGSYPDCICDAS